MPKPRNTDYSVCHSSVSNTKTLHYLGHVLRKLEIEPDQRKVENINILIAHKDQTGVKICLNPMVYFDQMLHTYIF